MTTLTDLVDLAATHGVRCTEPVVLRDRSNLLVWLRPAPVVARVPGLVAAVRTDLARHLGVDLAVAGYLHARGLPVVAPSAELPPGPHRLGTGHCAFWTHHRTVEGDPDPGELRAGITALHEALAAFPGDLSGLGPLADLRLGLARFTWTEPERTVFAARIDRFAAALAALPGQPLHGDTHSGNALVTANGLVWNDFEDAWHGPVEWDLAAAAEGRVPVPPPASSAAFTLCRALRRAHSALWAQVLRPGAYAEAARRVLVGEPSALPD